MSQPIESMAERLGYARDAKVLIVNSDDSGLCHSVNRALLTAWEAGIIRSTTAMAPCPWFRAFVASAKEHGIPVGIHLTATSEWPHYRWGPVAPRHEVSSLLDPHGCFYPDVPTYMENAKSEEVEREFRAQIEHAIALGVEPSHLDSHMGVYNYSEEFFEVAYRLAREYGISLRVGFTPRIERLHNEGYPCVDRLEFGSYDWPDEHRFDFYEEFLRTLEPGVTEMIIHCGTDDPELEAVTAGLQVRRALDAEFWSSERARRLIEELGIELASYDALTRLVPKGA